MLAFQSWPYDPETSADRRCISHANLSTSNLNILVLSGAYVSCPWSRSYNAAHVFEVVPVSFPIWSHIRPKLLDIMLPDFPKSPCVFRFLSLYTAAMSSKHHTAFLRFRDSDDPLAYFHLLVPGENVEEAGSVYCINPAIYLVKRRALGEDIGCKAMRLPRLFVFGRVISQL